MPRQRRKKSDSPVEKQRIENPRPAPPTRFMGHDTLLEVLHAGLRAPAGPRWWVLSGPDGIGKTALAAEYARRHGDAWSLLWWIDAGHPSTLALGLFELGQAVGVASWAEDDPVQLRRELTRHLESRDGWLLILDGVTDRAAVEAALPADGRGAVLLTAATWSGAETTVAPSDDEDDDNADDDDAEGDEDTSVSRFEEIAVPPLGPTEAQALLFSVAAPRREPSDEEREAAAALAVLLGGLPLALRLAARVGPLDRALAGARTVVAEIYEAPDEVDRAEDAREALEIAWYALLRRIGDDARALVAWCAQYAAAPVARSTAGPLLRFLKEKRFAAAVSATRRAGLLTVDDETFALHPALLALAREGFDPAGLEQRCGLAFLGLCQTVELMHQADITPPGFWYRLLPHLLSLAPHFRTLEPQAATVGADVLGLVGTTLTAAKEPALAVMAFAQATALGESLWGETAALATLVRHHAEAACADALSQFGAGREALLAKARPLLERALALSEATAGRDSPEVASLCAARGHLEDEAYCGSEAIGWYRRALELARTCPGAEKLPAREWAASVAGCQGRAGNHAEAAAALREAIELGRAEKEPSLFHLAMYYSDLGDQLGKAGDLAAARAALAEGIRIGTQSFQKETTLCFADYYQAMLRFWRLGEVATQQGDDAAAVAGYEGALALKSAHSYPRDREVGNLQEALGDVRARRGELDLAEASYRAAREVFAAARSAHDGSVGEVASKLGDVLRRKGDLDAAASAFAEAIRCFGNGDRVIGYAGWHEWPLLTHRLAELALARDDPEGAREHLREGTEWIELHGDMRYTTPDSIIETARVLGDMAASWRAQGDLPAAWSLYGLALEWAEPVLGEDHAVVAALRASVKAGRGEGIGGRS